MRPIDADALINECDDLIRVNATPNRYIDLIKNAPTIKPERTQGEWVWRSTWQWCSECGALKPRKYPYLNFCPKCGADMRKGGTK